MHGKPTVNEETIPRQMKSFWRKEGEIGVHQGPSHEQFSIYFVTDDSLGRVPIFKDNLLYTLLYLLWWFLKSQEIRSVCWQGVVNWLF